MPTTGSVLTFCTLTHYIFYVITYSELHVCRSQLQVVRSFNNRIPQLKTSRCTFAPIWRAQSNESISAVIFSTLRLCHSMQILICGGNLKSIFLCSSQCNWPRAIFALHATAHHYVKMCSRKTTPRTRHFSSLSSPFLRAMERLFTHFKSALYVS